MVLSCFGRKVCERVGRAHGGGSERYVLIVFTFLKLLKLYLKLETFTPYLMA